MSRLALPALAGAPTAIFAAADLGGLSDVRRVFVDATTAFVTVSESGTGLGTGRLYQRANDAATPAILLHDSTAAALANPVVASSTDVYFGRRVGATAYKIMKVPRGVANSTPVEVADAPDLVLDLLVDGTHVYWLGSRGVPRRSLVVFLVAAVVQLVPPLATGAHTRRRVIVRIGLSRERDRSIRISWRI